MLKDNSYYEMPENEREFAFTKFPLIKYIFNECNNGHSIKDISIKCNRSKSQVLALISSWRKKGLIFNTEKTSHVLREDQYQKNYIKKLIEKDLQDLKKTHKRNRNPAYDRKADFFECSCGNVHTLIVFGLLKDKEKLKFKCPVIKKTVQLRNDQITMTNHRHVNKEIKAKKIPS